MNCYGRELTLERDGAAFAVRGFFQPVTGKVERLVLPEVGTLGLESRERFVYIGPAEPEAVQGDLLTVEGKRYHIRSAQVIWGNGQPVYCWGMCVEMGGEDLWGSSG